MILRAGQVAIASVPDSAFRATSPRTLNFEELVQRYQGPLLRFLYGLVGDRELAADLCQDTFLSAFGASQRLDPDACLDAWLYTIALNHVRGVLRRRRLLRWVPFVKTIHDRAAGRDLASRVVEHEQHV